MATDRDAAWAEVHDPATEPRRLMEIASEYPEFAATILDHPNSYPELAEWLRTYGTSTEPTAPATSVSEVSPPATATPPGALTFEDEFLLAGAAAVSAFENVNLLSAAQEIAAPLLSKIRPLVGANDKIEFALPGILTLNDRHDAVALFTRNRLIFVWRGPGVLTPSLGSEVVHYADVSAARIGAALSSHPGELALYFQADTPYIFTLPVEDAASAEFLTRLARGVPLAQLVPELSDDASPTTDAAATPATVSVAAAEESAEVAAARRELAQPTISGERMFAIAAAHPELHTELAKHPRAYPELLDWLASRPEKATKDAVSARLSRDRGAIVPVGNSTAASAVVRTTPDPVTSSQRSGWEVADSGLNKADKAAGVVVNVAATIYGIFLTVVGIIVIVASAVSGGGAWWAGAIVAIYGIYVALPLPGWKLIIW